MSPRTTFVRSMRRAETSSLWGTQSRIKQMTSASRSSSRRTSQPPSSPDAPVTSVGRSRQNVQFPVGGDLLEGVGFEARLVFFQVIEEPWLEHHEATVDPALTDLRLLGEAGDAVAAEEQP